METGFEVPGSRFEVLEEPVPARTFEEFLESHLGQEMLRFTTAGSVDDGKSTLIGRLLHDTKSVYEDQLAAVQKSRVNRAANGHVDFSLLTDGLKAEREQGITIDVAYRYFSTSRRKFIIADTPGHTQHTRNMVTGCSTADLVVILVDARIGITEQNVSLLKSGKVRGVRFDTLNKICEVLNCQPGHLLEYRDDNAVVEPLASHG